jgi:hypothetical protein
VLVRVDIPLADQIVQVGHACLEAGRRFAQPAEPCHLVLLSVASERHLHDAIARAELAGVRCVVFNEPDDNLGDTAACSEPVLARGRRLFQRFSLWRAAEGSLWARGPPHEGCAVSCSALLCQTTRSLVILTVGKDLAAMR